MARNLLQKRQRERRVSGRLLEQQSDPASVGADRGHGMRTEVSMHTDSSAVARPDGDALSVKHVKFYGASDDLIEVEGDVPGCDEYNGEHGVFTVGGLVIAIDYTGIWAIRVAQVDEDVPVTASDLRLSVAKRADGTPGYSMVLDMDVPDGSHVTKVEVS